jgi:sugar phosphate permease
VLPVVAVLVDGLGWRGAYVISGLVTAAFYVPAGILILRNKPSDVGEVIDGDSVGPSGEASDTARLPLPSIPLKQAMRTPFFWVCAFGFMCFFFGMMGWMVHQVPFYESVGMSRATATFIVSMVAALGIVARLSIGLVADRFKRFEVVVVFLLGLLMLAMITLLVSTSPVAIAVFVACWVIGTSMGPLVESIVLINAFGLRHFGSILGAMLVVETTGQVLSPSLAGYIYDSSGSYDGALIVFASAFAIGMVLFVIAARMETPMNYRATQEA